ncbi:unnamed protein product [Amaranthus hypochondriacus]
MKAGEQLRAALRNTINCIPWAQKLLHMYAEHQLLICCNEDGLLALLAVAKIEATSNAVCGQTLEQTRGRHSWCYTIVGFIWGGYWCCFKAVAIIWRTPQHKSGVHHSINELMN